MRRGPGAKHFSSDWARQYVSYWSGEWEARRVAPNDAGWGKDMKPLGSLVERRCSEMRAEAASDAVPVHARSWTVAPLFAGLNARPAANFIQPIKLVVHSHDVNLASPPRRRERPDASPVGYFCQL